MTIESPPVTELLADFAASLRPAQIPAKVMERACVFLGDVIGIGIRARFDADSTASIMAAATRLGLAQGQCTVFGDRARYAPAGAALINGALAHSLDFDDTHAPASLHASAPIVPAALACAELTGASGAQVMAAIIAGFEVQIRLSLAMGPSDHYRRGFHPTATCGAFGAAAAAGNLLGLDNRQMENAFGAAGSQAAGSMRFLANGSWNKRYHVGHAAMCGLTSAVLAEQGFVGSSQAIEGAQGFLHAYAPNPDPQLAIAELNETWQTLALAIKPYPSCRATHAAIDAIVALREQHQIDWRDVDSVTVGLADTAWRLVGDSDEYKQSPASVVDGQFSMPFCAAVALREGNLSWDDYRKHIADRDTLSICKRVSTRVDAGAEAHYPENLSASVCIRTKGRTVDSLVVVPKGEPGNFVTERDMHNKFYSLVSPYVVEPQLTRLFDAIANFADVPNVSELLAMGRGQEAAAA